MVLEPIADPPSEPHKLGWHKVESRGARKRASGELLPEYRLTSPTPLSRPGDLSLVCLKAQDFYLRMGEQVRGSQATRSTPRPWESSTKGSRIPSRSDLWVERRTSGEPCSRESQREVPIRPPP